jgi:hypothetical protein
MAEKVLALFSSDSRELYKADAYRVLALPTGYSLQLRYRRKHIHGGVLPKIGALVGQKGVVFFVAGNDVSKPENERNITLTSLREFEVVSVREDAVIETFNFYIKLGEFVDATPHLQTVQELKPPQAFVSELEIERGPNGGWKHRITAVAPHFPDLTFVLINGIYQGQKAAAISFNEATLNSEFLLDEEARYACNLTVHVPTDRPTGISVFNSSPVSQLNVPTNHRLGAQNDSISFEIQTQALQQREVACSSFLWDRCGKPEPEVWRVELRWRVRRGRKKAVLFGVLMSVAAAGVAVAKIGTDKLATTPTSWLHWVLAISGGMAIGVCAGWLYEFFNKK